MSPAKDNPGKGGDGKAPAYEPLVDPGADWVLGEPSIDGFEKSPPGPGIDYFFLPERKNKSWLPILVALKGISVQDFASGAQFEGRADTDLLKKQWQGCTVFADLDLKGPGATAPNFFCAPTVTKAFFDLLKQRAELRAVVASVTLGLPLESESLPGSYQFPPPKLPT